MNTLKQTIKKQLIILGNGFDLQCGLPTRYQDFFDNEFGINLIAKISFLYDKYLRQKKDISLQEYIKKERANLKKHLKDAIYNNPKKVERILKDYILQSKLTLEELASINLDDKNQIIVENLKTRFNKFNKRNFNPWCKVAIAAFAFIRSKSPIMWNDVETMIYQIVTWILVEHDKSYWKVNKPDDLDAHKYYSTLEDTIEVQLNHDFTQLFNGYDFEDQRALNVDTYQSKFRKVIENCFYSEYSPEQIAFDMLKKLVAFEERFANFISITMQKNQSEYYDIAMRIFKRIIGPNIKNKAICIDVLNFNYSLDMSFATELATNLRPNIDLSISSWSNIHGLANWNKLRTIEAYDKINKIENVKLPKPIFGIDNHDILGKDNNGNIDFDDPRRIFTKSYRLLDNHINDTRTKNFQSDVDVISFYGHSLSQADYSYFESIFDQYDIFNSNVKLEFYYWPGFSKDSTANHEEMAVLAKTEERKTIKKIVRLLTSYGMTLKNEHGENIINKLVLEQRLTVLPNFEIDEI